VKDFAHHRTFTAEYNLRTPTVCYLQQDITEFISVLIILRVTNKSAKIHICLEICSYLYRIVDKFSHYLISLNLNGLWATKSEDVGLIVCEISFQD